MTHATLIMGLLAAASASTASAQITHVATNRYLLVANIGDTASDGPRTTAGPALGLWDNAYDSSSAVDGENGGSAEAVQTSTVASGIYSAYLDGRADAFGDGFAISNGYGESHYTVDFSLAGAGSYALDGWVNAFGQINGETSEAFVELTNIDTNTVIWSIFREDTYETFSEAGALAAGNYRIDAYALTIVNRDFVDSFGDSTATVDFDLVVVPAPASLALASLAGIGCVARRRRN